MSQHAPKKYEPTMELGPIKEVLGEHTPDIVNEHGHPTPLGRHRLSSALINKFGDNYRNIPAARKALEHFDKEHEYFKKLRKIRGSV